MLNYAKTYANIIVKGSLIVNMGRGGERVTNSTVFERSSSINRMFFCLFGTAYYSSPGRKGDVGGVEASCFSQSEINLIPPLRLCSILMIPPYW